MKNPILVRKRKRILKSIRNASREMTEAVNKVVKEIEQQEQLQRANSILSKKHAD
jgi:hypothetical protein